MGSSSKRKHYKVIHVIHTEVEKETRTQIRTQILYKTLLKRYALILLNFSSMDIPSEIKEYLIPITLKLTTPEGQTIF